MIPVHLQESRVVSGQDALLYYLIMSCLVVFYLFLSQCTCKKAECRQGKIYVGKLPADQLTNDELTAHFAQVSYPVALCMLSVFAILLFSLVLWWR